MLSKNMKRKLLSLFMTAAMVTTLFVGLTITASADTPDLTITTQTELDNFLSSSSTYSGQVVSYEPTTTLTASSVKTNFAGTFEGNGNTINLNLNTSTGNTAFIGTLANTGTIKNLTFTGTVLVTTGDYVAAAVGYNAGIISKVSNSASVTASDSSYVGGIAGYNADQAGIYNCSNSAAIEGYSITGGICGENDGIVSACSNTGTGAVKGTRNRKSGIGGITGRNGDTDKTKAGYIVDCYNQANVTSGTVGTASSQGSWIGGIAGFQNELSYCKNCYDTGNIYGYDFVSYVVGLNENTSSAVQNCYYLSTAVADASAANPSNSNDPSSSKTDSEMKSSAFLTDLAGSTTGIWTQTTGNYPVLASHIFVVELTSYPSTLTYLDGASFSTTGMAITAVFDDGTTTNVTGYSVSPSTLSAGDTAEFVSGSYTYTDVNNNSDTVSYCFMIPVTVNAKPSSVTLGPSSSSATYNDLASALDAVASGGTVEVLGPTTISISSDTQWNNNVTIQRSANYSGSEPMFTVSAGSNTLTLTSMTIKGDADTTTTTDTLFGVTNGTLRLRGGVKLQDCATAVIVQSGATVEVNKATIYATNYSIYKNTGGVFIFNDFGGTKIDGTVYLAHTTLSNGYFMLNSEIPSTINTDGKLKIECSPEENNTLIAFGSATNISASVGRMIYDGSSSYIIDSTPHNTYYIRLVTV
jgi:hypothetical protein